ncbi:MAG: winged helix-turn-helix transcriptional regulator [Ruminococcaceae bacterium]|nr:winged helix-turn-helix transcriptional regulator [Oscillospiraceae bacterium]
MTDRFETFTILINRISRNVRKIKNLEMAEQGLRSSHISCLYYLYKTENMTATELCEKCEEDKATVSRSIDFLEENGYIVSQSKSTKKYKNPITLSEKGKSAGQEIAGKIDRVLDEISSELSEGERIEFYRSLTVISNRLDKMVKNLGKK